MKTNKARKRKRPAAVACTDLLGKCGLKLCRDCDGYWLEFRPPTGRFAHIYLSDPNRGPITRATLTEWAESILPNDKLSHGHPTT